MKPDPSKLRQQQQETETTTPLQFQQESQSTTQFNSVEEIIRFDAGQNHAPEAIAERLKESIAREPLPPKSWWRRFFSKRS